MVQKLKQDTKYVQRKLTLIPVLFTSLPMPMGGYFIWFLVCLSQLCHHKLVLVTEDVLAQTPQPQIDGNLNQTQAVFL